MHSPTHQTLLVTGGAGFIGSSFVEKLVQAGRRVIVLDALTYAGHKENLQGFQGPGSVELVIGNICDAAVVKRLIEKNSVDAIINFAAESHVDRSIEGPNPFFETNIRGTFVLLNAALDYWQKLAGTKREAFRFLQISTDEVYGSLGPQGRFNEQTPMAPNSPYSASKAAADHLVRAWHHTYEMPTLTTNCSNNYGPRQFPEKLIPHMINCALSGRPLPVYGDGKNVRDWIHVEDHCNGILLALERGKPGGTYCFGGNAERANIDVVKTICKTLDQKRPRADGKPYETQISFVKDRRGHDRRYAIDDSLAQKELGFKRRHDFESGLAETIQWYLDHNEWVNSVMRAKK